MLYMRGNVREAHKNLNHTQFDGTRPHSSCICVGQIASMQLSCCTRLAGSSVLVTVADPEGDPRVPWIPPFRLNLACKIETQSNLGPTRGPTVSPN